MAFFDRNGDGKKNIFDTLLEIAMANATVNDSDDTEDETEDISWREYCEDGTAYGVDPEDYDDESDYEDVLEEAKYGWRDDVDTDDMILLDPEEYETAEEYYEALDEAKEEDGEEEGAILTVSIVFDDEGDDETDD
ncbi:MAG: hypothetical protein IJ168_02925 [Eubacterium sp.]|nr:hypothetical protein [Eubacterium sp.]